MWTLEHVPSLVRFEISTSPTAAWLLLLADAAAPGRPQSYPLPHARRLLAQRDAAVAVLPDLSDGELEQLRPLAFGEAVLALHRVLLSRNGHEREHGLHPFHVTQQLVAGSHHLPPDLVESPLEPERPQGDPLRSYRLEDPPDGFRVRLLPARHRHDGVQADSDRVAGFSDSGCRLQPALERGRADRAERAGDGMKRGFRGWRPRKHPFPDPVRLISAGVDLEGRGGPAPTGKAP